MVKSKFFEGSADQRQITKIPSSFPDGPIERAEYDIQQIVVVKDIIKWEAKSSIKSSFNSGGLLHCGGSKTSPVMAPVPAADAFLSAIQTPGR